MTPPVRLVHPLLDKPTINQFLKDATDTRCVQKGVTRY